MSVALSETSSVPDTLAARWSELKVDQPRVRIRDAARLLDVTEAQLVALGCGGTTTRLQGPLTDIYKRLPELGSIMALTRNESAVHERRGVFGELSLTGHVGLVVGDDIDLRLFFHHYKSAFALRETHGGETRRSLQFFDGHGAAMQKIYVEDPERVEAFEAIVRDFTSSDQSREQVIKPKTERKADRPDEAIDVDSLQATWRGLKDTHDFFPMLLKHKVGREQALRLAGDDLARRLPNDTARTLLQTASSSSLPIMVFVGSPGCIQIHTGPVEKIKVMDTWLNVLDRKFNLHLREDHVASTWVVRKPTAEGTVTSIELFDQDGENIALFFGKRKPGVPESEAWRALVAQLEARS